MLTFQDQLKKVQEITGFSDTANVVAFKRDLNQGGNRFLTALGRTYAQMNRKTATIAGQRAYQYPEDAFRVRFVEYLNGANYDALQEVTDPDSWSQLKSGNQTGVPSHFFVQGFDQIELWPTPGATVLRGLNIIFDPKQLPLTQMDVTEITSGGTITVNQGSDSVTHATSGFTLGMQGRWLQVTDGSDDNWYRIRGVRNSGILLLENYFQGASSTALPFRIGEVMRIPEEYLEAPTYFALMQYYLGRDLQKANAFKAMFNDDLNECVSKYSKHTSNVIVAASKSGGLRGDLYDNKPIRTS